MQLRVAQINLQSNLSFFAFKSAVAALRSAIGLPALCPHPPPAHIPTCIHTFTHTIECSARGGGTGMLHPFCSAPKRGTHGAVLCPELTGSTADPQHCAVSLAEHFLSAFSALLFSPFGSEL